MSRRIVHCVGQKRADPRGGSFSAAQSATVANCGLLLQSKSDTTTFERAACPSSGLISQSRGWMRTPDKHDTCHPCSAPHLTAHSTAGRADTTRIVNSVDRPDRCTIPSPRWLIAQVRIYFQCHSLILWILALCYRLHGTSCWKC